MAQMTFLDFFSGIGGFRKGFELCGMRCVGHCEIDKYADRSYRAIHDVKEDEWYGEDITKTEPANLPRVNLWAGGFPCQDISVSGRQRGLAGKRSSLFFEIVRLLKGTPTEDRPEWLVLENVKNLLSVNRGWDFATVLNSLAEIGYHIEYGLLNSRFHGVPQNRERIYLVAYRHFRAEGGRKVFPVSGTNTAVVKKVIGGYQGERVYDADGISVTLTADGGGAGGKTGLYLCGTKKPEEWMECLKENGNEECGAKNYAGFLTQKKEPDMTRTSRCLVSHYNAGITRFGESSGVLHCKACDGKCVQARAALTPERENKRQNGRRFKNVGEPGFTLTAVDRHGVMMLQCPYYAGMPIREATKQGYVIARHGDGVNLSYPNSTVSRGRVGKQCAQTLVTGGSMGVVVYCRIRRLTPRECFRLQAFEDFLFDRAKAAGVSDAQFYKQAGNSVTVNIVYEIGLRLAEMEAGILEV